MEKKAKRRFKYIEEEDLPSLEEEEIKRPETYWTVTVNVVDRKDSFWWKFTESQGHTEEDARAFAARIRASTSVEWFVQGDEFIRTQYITSVQIRQYGRQ